jgi:hypothetical protein
VCAAQALQAVSGAGGNAAHRYGAFHGWPAGVFVIVVHVVILQLNTNLGACHAGFRFIGVVPEYDINPHKARSTDWHAVPWPDSGHCGDALCGLT